MEGYSYAYVLGDFIIGLPVFAVLYYYRKDLRREMIIAGLLLGVVSMLTEHWYLLDYWHPEDGVRWRISLGDLFYGFFFGGIASVIYEAVTDRHFLKRPDHTRHWSLFLFPVLLLGAVLFIAPLHFGMNSIYTSAVAGAIIASIFLVFRGDLFWDAIISSILFGLITLVGYIVYIAVFPGIIEAWWNMDRLSGVYIFGVPLEELVFAFGMGVVVGPAYEFFAGLRFKKR